MLHTDGGFFSSQDDDSEGVEGAFFAWSWDQLVDLVGEDVARWFGATPRGNWEPNRNVLWVQPEHAEGAAPRGLAAARRRLFEAREARVRPGTDDKVLAGWNGLAISALAEAGRAFGDDRYVQAAIDAARF